MRRSGFSLVELSIVLVILGLLTGGILAGQSLIRASELRAVTTEHDRYVTAVATFRDKYFAIPGDMSTASKFWNAADGSTGSTVACNTATAAGTCNGNGDGNIRNAGSSNEPFRFWQQLALAGLIEGTYTGVQAAGGVDDGIIGSNVPRSKISNAGWSIYYAPNDPGNVDAFAFDYGNYMQMGTPIANSMPFMTVITPEEMWNIDTKMDDGMPGRGKVLTRWIQNCTNAANQNDVNTTYKLTERAKSCTPVFPRAF